VQTDEPRRQSSPDDAREAFGRQAWRAAYSEFVDAERVAPLEPDDLERLSTAALLIGQDAESVDALSRAHQEYLNRGDAESAARCGVRLGLRMFMNGEVARGAGWLGRARRVLEEAGCSDCVVHGYLLIPVAIRATMDGDGDTAYKTFGEAVAIGRRFGDTDLVLLARHGQGRVLVRTGKLNEGLELFDEVMVGVTAGEASPAVVGDVYCSVISACSDVFDFHRAQEWTTSLSAWCASQPDLVAHRGECMVHRAEIAQFHGAWADAMVELTQACERLANPPGQRGVGLAFYQQADLHRLRGEFGKAESMYRLANQVGRSPQPGLALLRLAQGRVDAAAAAIRGAIDETRSGPRRPRILSACVEIMLAANDVSAAHAAADELKQTAADLPVRFLRATAAHASGAVRLAEGDARGALAKLREALAVWHELDAPYEAARTRELMALAHRVLGDDDSAAMDLDAAAVAYEHLGAATDLSRIEAVSKEPTEATTDGLTAREVEVLRLVATGKTNRAIAAALGISEKTIARHVSNIFVKLGISSRAAATAYAYEHDLATPST
jgi:DNA-binding CsgD family transcriptional regulator